MSVMTLILFGCTNSEPVDLSQTNADLIITKKVNEIIESNYFKNVIKTSTVKSDASRSSNNGNGVVIVETTLFTFFGFGYPDGFIVFAVLGEPASIKLLPNGTAKFSVEVDGPWCLWSDVNEGGYNNICYENNSGLFSVDYSGPVEVVEEPWGTVYHILQPYATPFLAKGQNFVLNDADTFDDNGTPDDFEDDFSYCREESVTEKIVNFKFIGKYNNKNDEPENRIVLNAH